ncbi:esterase-like activity of phytase family protein [Leptothrix discophora]|uniref:Esterase-like activity of phytase family protein n=1 Tax=Leptothrix discophora TaxID=89 RepID=A0ABT9G187_LEPDI|nr:esterase-like activity of phytase family protein [Leptothrix discophora]MDP4299958.1 esterase-like activity of phytase family protein [Leptothrix discophora]
MRTSSNLKLGSISLAALLLAGVAHAQTLTGWAQMSAATFSDGPTSGQFITPNAFGTHLPPYVGRQPVQGFSGVLKGPRKNTFHFLVDNGFGAQGNSADNVLRAYALAIDWHTVQGGSGTVTPADWQSGRPRASFDAASRLQLNDARRNLTLPIQADSTHYYGNPANPLVDPAIRDGRLLTGADFDIESFRRDHKGNFWFGDEFGPYLVKTDAKGTVLRSEIPIPGVQAPQNKDVVAGKAVANLPGSGGFEGLAIDRSGHRLYTLLERTVTGDPVGTLRIDEFDVDTESYTGRRFVYPLDAKGSNIGDMVAFDDQRFVVLERNNGTATTPNLAPFKKVYLIDLEDVSAGGVVRKTELVDLMNLADPHDLDGDGSTVFTFPYVTIENVLVLDPRTLLVVNDNNFPFGGGRAAASDKTEFLRIRLPVSLVPAARDADRDADRDDE